jgi:hypothetical protein
LAVSELDRFKDRGVIRIELEHLALEAGAALLLSLDVNGTQAELEKASEELGGHALAVTLLGRYLHDVFEGDIRCRGEIAALEQAIHKGRSTR